MYVSVTDNPRSCPFPSFFDSRPGRPQGNLGTLVRTAAGLGADGVVSAYCERVLRSVKGRIVRSTRGCWPFFAGIGFKSCFDRPPIGASPRILAAEYVSFVLFWVSIDDATHGNG